MCVKHALLLLLLEFLSSKAQSNVKFTNLKCEVIDRSFCDFTKCSLKAFNRTTNLVSIRAKLLQTPVTNISVNLDMRKRASGYKPFLYNVTFDACSFFRQRRNPIVRFLYSLIADYTNMNHTCPYDHELYIENLPSHQGEKSFINMLPMPKGDFGIFCTFFAYNVPRSSLKFFFTIT